MRRSFALALLLLLGGERAYAQARAVAATSQQSAEVTLAELLRDVPQSPALRAEELRAEVGLGDVRAAGAHPNPTLEYGIAGLVGGIPTNGGTQQDVLISQPLLWPGQLAARVEAAQASLRAVRGGVPLARAAVSLEVARAFADLQAAQERGEVLDRSATAIERVIVIVRGRAEAGAAPAWDVARVETELASLRVQREQVRAQELDASGTLAALLGRGGWTPKATGPWLDPQRLAARIVGDEHPLLAQRVLALQAAEARVRSEQALAVPPIEIGVGAIVSTDPEGGYLVGRVSMPLPIFDANQGAIERAERERDAAEAELQAARSAVGARAERARRVVERRRVAVESLQRAIAERLPALQAMSESAYAGGEASALELLDAVRTSRGMQLDRVESEQELRHAELELLSERIVGLVGQ